MRCLSEIAKGFFPAFGVFIVTLCITDLVFNSLCLTNTNKMLQVAVKKMGNHTQTDSALLHDRLRQRVLLYEKEIRKNHLYKGMVVNRHLQGKGGYLDECDSLLFSSLRYVALKKMGYTEESKEAWKAILQAHDRGKWNRHPDCLSGTSRDMLVGLLIALTQRPAQTKEILDLLFKHIGHTNGFFGDGPFYVSYMTPGIAENFRRVSRLYPSVQSHPEVVKRGFSTLEMDVLFSGKGFSSHLIALQIWLEMEISELYKQSGLWRGPRSVLWEVAKVLSPWTRENMYQQRHVWLTQKLVELDAKNLFYRWLRLRAGGVLGPSVRLAMMEELLEMPQFPRDGLPGNCHRRADYMWQRDSDEFTPVSRECTMQFSGVDFLWMAALVEKM